MKSISAVVLVLVFVSAAAPLRAAAAGPGTTIDDARGDFATGNYREALKKTSALMSSSSVKRDSTERYDLLMLKGECLLKLKQRTAAADAVGAAAAAMKSRRDLPRAATATALAALVKASPDLKYNAKQSGDGTGVDITDAAKRPAAMTALYNDLDARITPGIDKAMQDRSLVSTQKLLRDLWDLFAVEYAAKGDAATTGSKLQQLGGHARALMGEELDRLTTRLEQLTDLASEPTWVSEGMSYRGLNTSERAELKQAADYLMQIQQTAENGRRISQALGNTGENWDTLLADCALARDAAQKAYDRRY